MQENDLVTLDDGKSYALLKEIKMEDLNKRYFLGVEILNEKINFDDTAIFEEEVAEDGVYLTQVENQAIIAQLLGMIEIDELAKEYPEIRDEIEKTLNEIEKGGTN